MAAAHGEEPMPMISLRPEQALVGVPATENGRDVTHFFAEGAVDARVNADETLKRALAAIGSWRDLDWDETIDALDRIRHESEPTPRIEDL